VNTDPVAMGIVAGAAVIIIAIVGVRFAGRLGVPGLLLYLLIGVALGLLFPDVGVEDPGLAVILGYSALILILAQGGLTTPWTQLRPVLWPSLALATVGVAVSIAVVAVPLIWLAGLDTRLALILASVVAATDAAAVFSVLRRVNVVPRLRTLLEGEAGFNDAPVVVVVTLLATSSITAEPWLIPVLVLLELIGGAAIGIALGFAARWIMPRIALPAVGLYPIAALTFVVASYGVALLAHTSGFMAVYVAAVILGSSQNLPHRRSVLGFSDGLGWIAEIGLFVMLGLLADPARLPQSLGVALVAVLAVTFLGRPLWLGLRGAVPIILMTLPLLMIAGRGDEDRFNRAYPLVFVCVIVGNVIPGSTVRWVLRLLRLRLPSPPKPSAMIDMVTKTPLDTRMLMVVVQKGAPIEGKELAAARIPGEITVALLVRGTRTQRVRGDTRFEAGDEVALSLPERMIPVARQLFGDVHE